jgi:hypothetical protein
LRAGYLKQLPKLGPEYFVEDSELVFWGIVRLMELRQ